MTDPTALVLAYIADHFAWNAAAMARWPRGRGIDAAMQAASEVTEREYAELLARYCRPGFAGQPAAFGTLPMHDPDRVTVTSARPRGERCLVRTAETTAFGGWRWRP